MPEGATSGPVAVTVGGQTATGPVFTIDARQAFEGDYETQEHELQILGATGGTTDTTITVEGGSEIEIDLVENSTDEIEVDLEDFVEDSFQAADVAFGGTGTAIVDFEEDPIAEVSENEYELDNTDFEIRVGSETAPGEISGEGVLEDDVITFTFEYLVQGTSNIVTFRGEMDMEKQ